MAPNVNAAGPPVLAIFGPTASGKTAVAEAIADRIPAEIVSADSMQVYRGLPILTNQAGRPVRLAGIWDLHHEASVAEFARHAHEAIDEIRASGRTPLVAGGTGLYLRAALADLAFPPAPPPASRNRLERLYDRLGPERCHALLAERDPVAAETVHPNDRRRVVRALELNEAGRTLAPRESRLWTEEMRHPTIIFGLEVSKDVLTDRIEARTTMMFERGLEEEVAMAVASKPSPTARQVIGLQEVASLSREAAAEALTRRTRQYAAYQRKWMRRVPGLVLVNAHRPAAGVAEEILSIAAARFPHLGKQTLVL